MGRRSRNYLSMDERRSQLLELGLRLFGSDHYDAISIEQVAREAKVSKGLLYHYFGGKRDFYMAVVRYAAEQLLESRAPQKGRTLTENIREGLRAYFTFVTVHRSSYLAFMHGGLGADPAAQEVVEQTRGAIVQDILAGLRVETCASIVTVSVRSWLGAVEGAAIHLLNNDSVSQEDVIELLTSSLICHLMTANQLSAGQNPSLDWGILKENDRGELPISDPE